MKNLLYGTTALVAAGVLVANPASAADPIKLGVGGYMQAFFAFGSQDDGAGEPGFDVRGHSVQREGEVIFNGSTTLDNGLKVGAQVQIEAETCGDQIDETFLFVSGNFGRINIGSENSAPYLMAYASPAPSHWAHGVNSPNFSHAEFGGNAVGGFPHTNPVDLTSDAEKITYFTPRLAGFQFGVSYTPDTCEESGCGGTYSGFEGDNDANDVGEVLEFGVNYVGKFDQFGLNLSASYGFGDDEDGTGDDPKEWHIGGNATIAGITFGGAYHRSENAGTAAGIDNDDFNLGVRYAAGPWGVGIQYAHAKRDLAGGNEDELDAVEVGGSYTLGPGIILNGGVQFWDYQSGTNNNANENEAIIGFIGTHVAF